MAMDYAQYQKEVTDDIGSVLSAANCQPILFIGSGFSKRYANAPNWEELLKKLASACPLIDKDFAYYKQSHLDLIKIGSIFAEKYGEWAWDKGKSKFPSKYFSADFPKEIFIKHMAAELLKSLGPSAKGSYGSAALDTEIAALKAMSPHAIVTTNYDELLEPLFPEYERVIGQQVLRTPYLAIGEIFKIHGCVSDPLSLVLTEGDYKNFYKNQKYLSAKLLTYFMEHPLVFIGYRADDPNIKSILYDVDRMVQAHFELVPNIYILEWDPLLTAASYPARDKVLSVGEDLNIRIKSISTASFDWVFKALGAAGPLEKVNVKLLRSLMARAVELIRTDIPKKSVDIDYQTLEHVVASGDTFAKLFGVTSTDDPSKVNVNYPYVLTGVAEQLGWTYWSPAHALIDALKVQTGFDMKASDNVYHIKMKTGKKSHTSKYSQAAVDLLTKMKKGEPYTLHKDCIPKK